MHSGKQQGNYQKRLRGEFMATCIAHIRVHDGKAQEFEALARELYAASTGHEQDLVRYEYWRGQEPNSYYCMESFSTGFAGFLAHETSEHHEAAAAPIMALIADFRLEWVDPVVGAAPLGSSNEFALGPDATERERLYADLCPLKLANWWLGLPRERLDR